MKIKFLGNLNLEETQDLNLREYCEERCVEGNFMQLKAFERTFKLTHFL